MNAVLEPRKENRTDCRLGWIKDIEFKVKPSLWYVVPGRKWIALNIVGQKSNTSNTLCDKCHYKIIGHSSIPSLIDPMKLGVRGSLFLSPRSSIFLQTVALLFNSHACTVSDTQRLTRTEASVFSYMRASVPNNNRGFASARSYTSYLADSHIGGL